MRQWSPHRLMRCSATSLSRDFLNTPSVAPLSTPLQRLSSLAMTKLLGLHPGRSSCPQSDSNIYFSSDIIYENRVNLLHMLNRRSTSNHLLRKSTFRKRQRSSIMSRRVNLRNWILKEIHSDEVAKRFSGSVPMSMVRSSTRASASTGWYSAFHCCWQWPGRVD